MANKTKKKSSKAASSSDETVVRIKAGSSAPKKREATTNVAVEKVAPKAKKTGRKLPGVGIFRSIGSYFMGAWVELRQVRWPNRRATWSLTGAVLIYSAFFTILVLLLDASFKYLFEIILGK